MNVVNVQLQIEANISLHVLLNRKDFINLKSTLTPNIRSGKCIKKKRKDIILRSGTYYFQSQFLCMSHLSQI